MLLVNGATAPSDRFARQAGDSSADRYCYAQVLKVYHANVVYIGPGAVDRLPIRTDILFVRYYEGKSGAQCWNWDALEKVHFPSLDTDAAFGFVHPSEVIRGCHIVPAFNRGRRCEDSIGRSHLAQDSDDWKSYYVMWLVYSLCSAEIPCEICLLQLLYLRFVDRDMVMRLHWGLAPGHTQFYPHHIITGPAASNDSEGYDYGGLSQACSPGPEAFPTSPQPATQRLTMDAILARPDLHIGVIPDLTDELSSQSSDISDSCSEHKDTSTDEESDYGSVSYCST